ncbi:hypothetical protein Hanom_Chr17g01573771 [Helianthus anomalus]
MDWIGHAMAHASKGKLFYAFLFLFLTTYRLLKIIITAWLFAFSFVRILFMVMTFGVSPALFHDPVMDLMVQLLRV